MSQTIIMPCFGDLLNAGIQTIKNLSNRNSIGQAVFNREFEEMANVAPQNTKK